jgi:predicted DNA-binding WGR domain protein
MSLTPDDVGRMKVPELKAALEERDLDTSGLKAVLVKRLSEAVSNGANKKAESPVEEPPAKKAKGKAKGKAAAKEEAAAPVEEPPAKKPKGKAAAKEEAAAPAEEAADKGKGKAAPALPLSTAPAASSGGGGGGRMRQADRSVPGGASLAVHEAYDVKLMQTNIGGGKNNNKFYIIQVLTSEGKYFCWNRWGRLGEEGQNNGLEACASEEAAIKSFSKKFKDKTKNTWVTGAPASAFVKHDGKYQLVEVEDDAGGGDATLGKLSADQIGKGQAVLGLIKDALDGSGGNIAELSSQFYSLIPTQSGRAAPPPIGDMGMLLEKERSLDSTPTAPTPTSLPPALTFIPLNPPPPHTHTLHPTPHSQRPTTHPHPLSPLAPRPYPTPSAVGGRASQEHQLDFWLRMGFEDMEVTLLDNPLEQMRDLPLPPTLQAAAEGVCDKASIAQSRARGKELEKAQAGGPAKRMGAELYAAIVLYTGNAIYRALNLALRQKHAQVPRLVRVRVRVRAKGSIRGRGRGRGRGRADLTLAALCGCGGCGCA